nr:unnamed protein product [Digitaria exilis]
MESLVSAIVSDLLSRALSMAIDKYYKGSNAQEAQDKVQRLERVLLRINSTIEAAEGRHITNQAMLRMLEMLRQGMYEGHYMIDTVRYRRGLEGDDVVSGGAAVALSRLNSVKHLLSFRINGNTKNTVLEAESLKKLDKMLGSLERMIGDTVEFVMFLEGYPRICRQPYDTHLILDKIMFCRQAEMETVINFLLRPEITAGNGNPGVLPIVGAARVGKSTLVEHVCLDERVRGHFSSIVLFTGDDLGAGNFSALNVVSGVIKHRDITAQSSGTGKSLAIIELSEDMEEETWRRLYTSASGSMGHGSKIIVTSRSDKIVAFGTVQALRLKVLTTEAYWYFFKALAFGSTNPDDQPELASVGMEIAMLLKGVFTAANIVSRLLRDNLNTKFWRRVLWCLRDFSNRHLRMFGEDPVDRIQKGKPVFIWMMARAQHAVMLRNIYQQDSSTQHVHGVPKLTAQDILAGHATRQGKFTAVMWRSSIPPYYTYMVSCESHTDEGSTISKKRPREDRI